MEDVVGIVAREPSGSTAAFMTWGRLYGATEEQPLLESVRTHLQKYGVAKDAELELCTSLGQVAAYPYFFEALLWFAREPIEFGKSYKKWVNRKRKAVEKNREIFFLGRKRRGEGPADTRAP